MKRRITRCPCGTKLVEGRCPPCDAIAASRKAATAARLRRREEEVDARRVNLDRQLVGEAAARIVPQLARERAEGRRRALRMRRVA